MQTTHRPELSDYDPWDAGYEAGRRVAQQTPDNARADAAKIKREKSYDQYDLGYLSGVESVLGK